MSPLLFAYEEPLGWVFGRSVGVGRLSLGSGHGFGEVRGSGYSAGLIIPRGMRGRNGFAGMLVACKCQRVQTGNAPPNVFGDTSVGGNPFVLRHMGVSPDRPPQGGQHGLPLFGFLNSETFPNE